MAKSIDDTNPDFGGLPLSDVGLCDGSLHTSHNVGLRDELGGWSEVHPWTEPVAEVLLASSRRGSPLAIRQASFVSSA